jgi:hypothetical protein
VVVRLSSDYSEIKIKLKFDLDAPASAPNWNITAKESGAAGDITIVRPAAAAPTSRMSARDLGSTKRFLKELEGRLGGALLLDGPGIAEVIFGGIDDWSGAVTCPVCCCGTCRWP